MTDTPDLDGLEEKLARYLDADAFENHRRSSRNQHAANLSKTRARKIAKRVLKFKPLAEALARRTVGEGGIATCPIDASPCGVTCDSEERRACREAATIQQKEKAR